MNINARSELFTRLHEDEHFAKLKSNRERIEYVLTEVHMYDQFRAEIKDNMDRAKKSSAKSLSKAINFKEEAQLFMRMNSNKADCGATSCQLPCPTSEPKQALEPLAKAILYTPISDASLLANLYARKAQVHFNLAEYEAALYSINLSIDNLEANSSEAIKLKFYIIKVNSLKMLSRYEEAIDLLNELLLDKQQILVQTETSEEDLLQLRQEIQELLENIEQEEESEQAPEGNLDQNSSDEYFSYRFDPRCSIVNEPVVGRHFMALEDIEADQMLLTERPYSVVMNKEYMHKKCTACYKDLDYKWYPCWHCTEVVFCDRKCALQAYDTFHRHECGMLSLMLNNNGTSPALHVFRMVSRVGPLEAYRTEHSLPDYCIEDYLAEPNQRDLLEVAKTPEEKNRAYKMSAILWNHNEKHGHNENVAHTIYAIETAAGLDLVHHFRAEEPSDEFLINFIEMLILDARRIVFNVFGWQEFDAVTWELLGSIAHSQCLVGSLINHSCVPNTLWEFNQEGVIEFKTNRAIRKGEEITISYGTNRNMSYSQRQKRLNHYFFACKCDACFEDARSGPNLRCVQCSGPVVFDSAVNQEPALSGKCLLCYTKYNDFEQTIQRLSTAKQSIKSIKSIGLLVKNNSELIRRTTELIYEIAELSLPSSKAVLKSIIDCCTTIECCGPQVDLPLQDKLRLALFINRHLVDHFQLKKNNNANTIRILQFWFDNLLDCIAQFSSNPLHYNPDESEMWNATLNLYRQLKQAIRSQVNSKDCESNESVSINACIQVLCQFVDTRLKQNEQVLRQYIRDYGQHLVWLDQTKLDL